MTSIQDATGSYEQWLRKYLTVVTTDLDLKHQHMAESSFMFFRATFYRWMQQWQAGAAGTVTKAPAVLGVGDLHVENFGTWRDSEARLVWGINDFDEAYELPYTIDLVRLATSAHLAIDGSHLRISHRDASNAILEGYREGIENGGLPFVLAEKNPWLRVLVSGELRDPQPFWSKLDSLSAITDPVLPSAVRAVEHLMPARKIECRWVHRTAGLGSLGRQRYVAIGSFCGAQVAREAKAMAPSACVWARGKNQKKSDLQIHYQEALEQSVRAPDPFVRFKGRWIVRRLAPDCSRVELSSLPHERDEGRLLHAMGFETANVHLSRPAAVKTVLRDIRKRPKDWLHRAAVAMYKVTLADFEAWQG